MQLTEDVGRPDSRKGLDLTSGANALHDLGWIELRIRERIDTRYPRESWKADITERPSADQSSKAQTQCPVGITLALASKPIKIKIKIKIAIKILENDGCCGVHLASDTCGRRPRAP